MYGGRVMAAEFKSACAGCGQEILPGMLIWWDDPTGPKHSECLASKPHNSLLCSAKTAKGARCSINADPDSEFCHVHRPDGRYQENLSRKRQPARHAEAEAAVRAVFDRTWGPALS